ncbi:Pycsar system effector family protein [Microcella alkaliphila]|uniref:Pycsar system effector family protein n=1 Tax=Microcella alkaliphila TaxID=279828 RepID=UPI00123780A8|nr:Pycsar system effector family protein [Microcella alkaliphila]
MFYSLALRILAESREELARADGKASILLAAASLIAGVVLSAILAGDWQPGDLNLCSQIAWWAGILSAAVGIVALATAVYPRTKYRGARPPSVIAYFGDVAMTPVHTLAKRLRETAASTDAVIDQMKAIAWIVDRKYLGIQTALWAFALAGLLCIGSVVVDQIFF